MVGRHGTGVESPACGRGVRAPLGSATPTNRIFGVFPQQLRGSTVMRPATNGSVGMRGLSYLDFDLLIERAGDRYRARVLDSPAGEVSGEFAIPFSDTDLELFVLRMGRSRGTVRGIESPAMEAAKDFGGRLYDSVFAGDLAGCLRSSLDEAGRAQSGLRIRLRLSDFPELAELPWQFL